MGQLRYRWIGYFYISGLVLLLCSLPCGIAGEGEGGEGQPRVCEILERGDVVEALQGNIPRGGKSAGKYFHEPAGDNDWNSCALACCNRTSCHVAFVFGGTKCYLVECVNRDLCKPIPSNSEKHKNSKFIWVRYPPDPPLTLVAPRSAADGGVNSAENQQNEKDENGGAEGTQPDSEVEIDLKTNPGSTEKEVESSLPNVLTTPSSKSLPPSADSNSPPLVAPSYSDFTTDPNDLDSILAAKHSTQNLLPSLVYGDLCGRANQGLCAPDMVCRVSGSDRSKRVCSCKYGATWKEDLKTCVQIVPDTAITTPTDEFSAKACMVGLVDCPENERCMVDDGREKGKRGKCDCIPGLLRHPQTHQCGVPPGKPDPVNDHIISSLPTTLTSKEAIKVTVNGSKEVVLPAEFVEITAVVEEKEGEEWRYVWRMAESPHQDVSEEVSDGEPYSSDWTHRNLKIQHLVPGDYKFHVDVSSNRYEGSSDFTMTVHPEKTPNRPPVAVIDPQTIQSDEGKKIILEGSKSHDPDGAEDIVSYKWALEKGPALPEFSPASTANLVLEKGLPPGNYTFSLTVIDRAGENGKTYATVFVGKGRDDKPLALAGSCNEGQPSGDFSVTLNADGKNNFFTICGNKSRDDKGIVKWLWTRNGNENLPADIRGTNLPLLTVSNIEPGIYSFSLKVEDIKGQNDEITVRVVVSPAKNKPPVPKAKIGAETALILRNPADKLDVRLDGTASSDDGAIIKWNWTLLKGPTKVEFKNADKSLATALQLVEGIYTFRLNVTDDKEATAVADVIANVSRSTNKPPVAVAKNVRVYLPSSEAVLDGSDSTDDAGVVKYAWKLLQTSPALLTILGKSAEEAKLRVGNLMAGKYVFNLTVEDGAGRTNSTIAELEILLGESEQKSIELFVENTAETFTERKLRRLQSKLNTLLNAEKESGTVFVEITKVDMDSTTGRIRVVFFCSIVADGAEGKSILSGSEVVSITEKNLQMLKEFAIHHVDTLYCPADACSGHGKCNDYTKICVCDRFWMPNAFTVFILGRRSNCDWSILYFLIVMLLLVSTVGGTLWAMVCVGKKWCRKSPKRRRYKLLDENSSSSRSGYKKKAKNGRNGVQMSSLLVSDSGETDTDDDTLYESSAIQRTSRSKVTNA